MPEQRSSARESVYEVSAKDVREAVNGICLVCGEVQHGGVEPDARKYTCEWCNADEVYGLEEALLMGRITVVGDE